MGGGEAGRILKGRGTKHFGVVFTSNSRGPVFEQPRPHVSASDPKLAGSLYHARCGFLLITKKGPTERKKKKQVDGEDSE